MYIIIYDMSNNDIYIGLSGQGIIFPARKIVGYPLILSRLPSNLHTVAARSKPGVRELSPEAEQPLLIRGPVLSLAGCKTPLLIKEGGVAAWQFQKIPRLFQEFLPKAGGNW